MAGAFLVFNEGITGRAKQENRARHLDVLSWNLSANLPVTVGASKGDLTTGQSSLSDLDCRINCDMSVVQQFKACLAGRHFKQVTLICTKDVSQATGSPITEEFCKLEMRDCVINNVSLSGSANSDFALSLSVTMTEYSMTYVEHDEKGNKTGQEVGGFNLAKHKEAA